MLTKSDPIPIESETAEQRVVASENHSSNEQLTTSQTSLLELDAVPLIVVVGMVTLAIAALLLLSVP